MDDRRRQFTYLIGICMPNIAAVIWLFAAILGFQQFGLPTVVFGLALAYSGAALYGWRVVEDRLRGSPRHGPDAPRQAHGRHGGGCA
jgi:hypothetical protein